MKQLLSIETPPASEIAKVKILSDNLSKNNGKSDGKKESFLSMILNSVKNIQKNEESGTVALAKEIEQEVDMEIENPVDLPKTEKSEVHIDNLLKLVSCIKSGQDTSKFPSDLKKIEQILQKEGVVKEIKEAKNIGELIKIAEKNGIEVKKFDFVKEGASLETPLPKTEKGGGETPKEAKNNTTSSEEIFKNRMQKSGTENKAESILKDLITSNKKEGLENIKQGLAKDTGIDEIKHKEPKEILKTDTKELKDILKTEQKEAKNVKINIADDKQNKVRENSIENAEKKAEPQKIVQEVKEPKGNIAPAKEVKKTLQAKTEEEVDEFIKSEKPLETKKVDKEAKIKPSQTENIPRENKPENTQNIAIKQTKQQTTKQGENIITQSGEEAKSENNETKSEIKSIKQSGEEAKSENNETKSEIKSIKNDAVKENQRTESNIQAKNNANLRETLRTFASELQEKIENYKPPLMKLKMNLKPQNMGEVEVTLLNRGNNLTVNINSNANTMALFTQNQAEFKNSLVNMGFTNLSMNFGEKKDNQNGHNNQGKKSQKGFSFEDESKTEEITNMELFIPRYV